MDIARRYIERAKEIIGERTPGEETYDREVLRWIEKGEGIEKAIMRANEKYPEEALDIGGGPLADLQSRYEYLLEHERIMRTLKR